MKCLACGLENENDAKFCIACGNSLASVDRATPPAPSDTLGEDSHKLTHAELFEAKIGRKLTAMELKFFAPMLHIPEKFKMLPTWSQWAIVVIGVLWFIAPKSAPNETEIRKYIAGKWSCDTEVTQNGKVVRSDHGETDFFPNGTYGSDGKSSTRQETSDWFIGTITSSYSINGNNIALTEHLVGRLFSGTWDATNSTATRSGKITEINGTHLKYVLTERISSIVPTPDTSTTFKENCTRI